jgi:hypothetical protein
MALNEIEEAEKRLAAMKARHIETGELIARLCALQEQTEAMLADLNLKIINARLALGKN